MTRGEECQVWGWKSLFDSATELVSEMTEKFEWMLPISTFSTSVKDV